METLHSLGKVVADERFAGPLQIPAHSRSVEKVGVPDENVSLTRQKLPSRQIMAGNQLSDIGLIALVVDLVLALAELFVADLDLPAQRVRQPVGSRVVVQGPGVGMNVFAGDPGRHKISGGAGRHVNGIGMRTLFSPFVGSDGLERPGGTSKKKIGDFQQAGVVQDLRDLGDGEVGVQIALGPGISGKVAGMELLPVGRVEPFVGPPDMLYLVLWNQPWEDQISVLGE